MCLLRLCFLPLKRSLSLLMKTRTKGKFKRRARFHEKVIVIEIGAGWLVLSEKEREMLHSKGLQEKRWVIVVEEAGTLRACAQRGVLRGA